MIRSQHNARHYTAVTFLRLEERLLSTDYPGMTPASDPAPDPVLRSKLLDFYIENQSGSELAEWLRDLGVHPSGPVQERRDRVRSHTRYLSMPAREFPEQTRHYLDPFTSDALADLCLALGLPDDGTREDRYQRIMREVHYREGWMPRYVPGASPSPSLEQIAAHLELLPFVRRGKLERDFCGPIACELVEVFGERSVHEQLPIAHGSTLRIDFHVGPPLGDGVGVEVKVPASNGDVQRALGQIDQYITRYGPKLVMVIVPDFISEASLILFENQLRSKAVHTLVRRLDYA